MFLGELVKKYRTDHDLSMDDFAAKSGLSKGYISMLEKNRNPKTGNPIIPSLETIKQVSNAIGIGINEIIALLDDDQKVSLEALDNLQSVLAEDFAKNEGERKVLLIARKADDLPPEKREKVINFFEETIDTYLAAMGDIFHKNDTEEDR